jgi:L-threonylcarbamoyladenylate synthase
MPAVMSRGTGARIVPATPEAVREAAGIIREGGLVAFPTETVYGLGANALDAAAVRNIFRAKGRPQDNPLILHVAKISDADKYAEVGLAARRLMRAFWPGPLSVVMFSNSAVPMETRANLETVAIRMPLHPIALALIEESGFPIAAPSANRSGRPSPTSAAAVADDLGDSVDMILDGGHTAIGVESTVVDATADPAVILRHGGVTKEMLSSVVDLSACCDAKSSHRSPGTRHRHYAPYIPLSLWDGEAVGSFGIVPGARWCYMGMREPVGVPVQPHKKVIFESLEDYARELFSTLREFERCGGEMIVAELPDEKNLGRAICNRLKRAAGSQ